MDISEVKQEFDKMKQEFDCEYNHIMNLKRLLERLRGIEVFKSAVIEGQYIGQRIYLDENEVEFLNDAWSNKINSLIDEIKNAEEQFIDKWKPN